MADYVAVLKKTIDGLGNTTPEIRKKVYEKARAAISKKLMAIDPPPAKEVFDQQMQALDQAVEQVEAEYGAQPDTVADNEPVSGPEAGLDVAANDPVAPEVGSVASERWDDNGAPPLSGLTQQKKSRGRGLIWAVLLLVVIGAGGYFAWANQGSLQQYVDMALGGGQPGAEDGKDQPADTASQSEKPTGEDTQDSNGGPEQSSTKFTQRLTTDGREVDEGPAAGEPTVGEGTSISNPTPEDGTSEPQSAQTNDTSAPAGETPSLPVGQKAIYYEERTSSLDGSAQPGAVVWSVIQESPGGDLPPEPAIRGDLTIPENGVSLRITFRRNADKTLPASHIIELVFETPGDFAGGTIDGVLRITMKDSEQATGNPLIGIPAKIADGFFLVALTDAKAEVETNMTLLRRQSWLDIPIAYGTGRRALLTMEKGVPGDKVFDEVLTAWQAASAGQ